MKKAPGKMKGTEGIYHVRVGLHLEGGDHHPMFSFYNVRASDKHQAGVIAKRTFCQEFGATEKNTEVEYVWAEGTMIDERLPVINQ